MKLFFLYLRQQKSSIAVFFLFILIFAAVFYFYSIPVGAVVYPACICLVISAVIFVLRYMKTLKRRRFLEKIKTFDDAAAYELPGVDGMTERELCRIIDLLIEYEKELSASNDKKRSEIKDYYTMWVHQIKTPISSMRLKLEGKDTEEARSLMSDLLRIEHYVEMVLVFMRLDSDATDYVIKEVDLDELIRQTVKKFAGEFILRKISLEYEGTDLKVVSDEKWLSFVIEQLLSNALKYTPKGKITVSVSGETLTVSDTGIGVAAGDIPRIFEKGYTGMNGRADKSASGVGLYLCRRICVALGHKITASSEVGKGTSVSIDLSREPVGVE